MDRDRLIKAWEIFRDSNPYEICDGREFRAIKEPEYCMGQMIEDTIALLKEQGGIIQCKDCYYYHKPEYGFTIGDCTYRTAWYPVKENEFCSLAKRKEGR